ncbi:MAG: CobN component of cobalt chelatase involved in biosynthesis [Bryobacterales bacterium]|nr:CobN component of cobalt chelatase involved in biosynthesis [Bryobacterales bacterium]
MRTPSCFLAALLTVASVPAALCAERPKVVLVMHTEGAMISAADQFRQRFGAAAFDIAITGEKAAAKEIEGANILFMEHPTSGFLQELQPAAQAQMKRGMKVVTDIPEVLQRHWNVLPEPALNNRLLSYFQYGGEQNLTHFLMVLYEAAGGAKAVSIGPPVVRPVRGVYHPRAPKTFANLTEYLAWYRQALPGKGRLAIVSFYQSNIRDNETQVVDALLTSLEKQGLAAAGVFGWPASTMASVLQAPQNDPACVNLAFTLSLSRPEDAAALEKMDIHVIGLMAGNTSYEEWAKSDRGVSSDRVGSSLNSPERNGATEPILVSTQESDPSTGIYHIEPIAERVEMAARRAKRWIVLRDKPNAEKKLAMLYYNNPPGKGNIGASYLNLPPSIVATLQALQNAGYNVGNRLPTSDELLEQLLRVGRNVELWAPGELDAMVQQGGVVLISVEKYHTWFDALPKQFRDAVNGRWGAPEAAKLMTIAAKGRKFFVIPGMRFGNVFLGPQLLRSSSEEYTNVQHSATLPPHHGYVASYLYYRHQLEADAIMHMGRHGTLEWLPGKNAGQAGWDTSEVLLADLPNLNYYIMDGGGEALQARRRAAAVDISDLTPMIASGGSQQRFQVLEKAVEQWTSTRDTAPPLAEQYREQAFREARRLKLDTQLSLPEGGPDEGNEAMKRLAEFLELAEDAPIPLGLPVLGQAQSEPNQREGLQKFLTSAFSPNERKLIDRSLRTWSDAIFDGKPPEVEAGLTGPLREKLFRAFDEAHAWLDNLRLSPDRELGVLPGVLTAHFLPSGIVGDPLGVPSALPSGRNLHDTDPALFPTRAAWEVGKKLANQLIDRYRKEHDNAYPERTSMVLWSGETGRSQGTMEAEALYLMGVAPEWNARNVVDRLRLIPDEQLGRPRVNVLFTASGLYRDGLADKILLLDKAARLAAAAGDNALSRQNARIEKDLVASGVAAEEAKHLAAARVFSEAPGAYGNGISNMVELDGSKEQAQAIAELYLAKTNYVYTDKVWGGSTPRLLANQLQGNQMILHSRSSNLYGVADNDDVYQYVGGLDAASRSVGASPQVMFNNLRAAGRERMETARDVLASELNSRNWNPKWIEGMKAAGYSGARVMVNSVEYLYGWQATSPQNVDASVWKKTYDVYVADEYNLDLPKFLAKANPYAQQQMIARLIEIDRQGVYKFSKAEQAKLLAAFVQSVSKLGVACSAVVCGNRTLRRFVTTQAQALSASELSKADIQEFARKFAKATSPAASSGPANPKVSKAKPSWLKNITMIDLNAHPRAFLRQPFGIEWPVWIILSTLLGWIYPILRRRKRLWSSPLSLHSKDVSEL